MLKTGNVLALLHNVVQKSVTSRAVHYCGDFMDKMIMLTRRVRGGRGGDDKTIIVM